MKSSLIHLALILSLGSVSAIPAQANTCGTPSSLAGCKTGDCYGGDRLHKDGLWYTDSSCHALTTAGWSSAHALELTNATNTVQLQGLADKAVVRIQASQSEKKAFVDSAASKSADKIKMVLLRNGFTTEQLEGAKYVVYVNDNTSSSPTVISPAELSKVTVKVRVRCCPPELVIDINF